MSSSNNQDADAWNEEADQHEPEEEEEEDPGQAPPPPPPPRKSCLKECMTYGILGPHAIRFYCFKRTSVLHRESFNTKLMYLIFLGIITVFSCFFIIPYPEINIAGVWPCRKDGTGKPFTFDGYWGTCRGHAGYFLVYRVFLSAVCIFLIVSLLVIRIHNSRDGCRVGIHQGYWFWKYFLFFALVTVFFFVITLDNNAAFDEAFMFIGLVASFFFAFPTLIFILDVCEVIVIRIKAKTKKWKILYWVITAFILLLDFGGLAVLIVFYTRRASAMDEAFDNADVAGDSGDKTCGLNAFLVAYLFIVGLLLLLLSLARQLVTHTKYLNTGFLQAAVMFGHSIITVYLALGNSPDISCRPVWYAWFYNENQLDVAFTAEGFIHAVLVWLTLGYFTLGRGPRTDSAPLSRFWLLMCCMIEAVPESTAMDEYERITGTKLKDPAILDQVLSPTTQASVGTGRASGEVQKTIVEVPLPRASGQQTAQNITFAVSSKAPSGAVVTNTDGSSNMSPRSKITMWGAPPPRPENEDPFLDESEQCNYSWSLFHVFLSLGALSMMMGVTNFIRPRADGPLASNLPAFVSKLLISPISIVVFCTSIFVKIPIRWNWRKIFVTPAAPAANVESGKGPTRAGQESAGSKGPSTASEAKKTSFFRRGSRSSKAAPAEDSSGSKRKGDESDNVV